MTTRNPTRSLAPVLAPLPTTKPHTPALLAAIRRQTALLHIAITETVVRHTRHFANPPDTAPLHHVIAILLPDTAPLHHAIAMYRPSHQSRPRIPRVATEQGTLHNLMRLIPIH
jgi:hypothetical protein